MRRELRMKYLERIWRDYQKAGKKEKGQMLEEFCRVCGYHREYALRLVNAPLGDGRGKSPPKRRYKYWSGVISILEHLWKVAGYPWSERLKALIPVWMPWIREQYGLDPKTDQELLAISARQIDRRLAGKKHKIK